MAVLDSAACKARETGKVAGVWPLGSARDAGVATSRSRGGSCMDVRRAPGAGSPIRHRTGDAVGCRLPISSRQLVLEPRRAALLEHVVSVCTIIVKLV